MRGDGLPPGPPPDTFPPPGSPPWGSSRTFFGSPPPGYDLHIEPLPASMAQARYLERYQVLAKAVGLIPADDAWHTE